MSAASQIQSPRRRPTLLRSHLDASSHPRKRRRLNTSAPSTLHPIAMAELDPAPTHDAASDFVAEGEQDEYRQEIEPVFPLMKLPAELRLHVYHMAFYRDSPLLLHTDRVPTVNTDEDVSSTWSTTRSVLQRTTQRAAGAQRLDRYTAQYTTQIMTENYIINPYSASLLRDPINSSLLLASSQIYKEARRILYSENTFILHLDSGIHSLNTLHQRTRSLIRNVSLTVPSHHDILDAFADLIRLGLRYCWGLQNLTIVLPMNFPEHVGTHTNIYANAFHILRWLPKGCKVKVEGGVNETIRRVVEKEGRLMCMLDEVILLRILKLENHANIAQKSYLKRQHQMPDSERE